MRAVRVRSRHFNGRQPNGLNKNISVIRLRDKSSSEGEGGAYARDKNTSAGLCAKNAGGAYARGGGGGVFAGHYGTRLCINIPWLYFTLLNFT